MSFKSMDTKDNDIYLGLNILYNSTKCFWVLKALIVIFIDFFSFISTLDY